MKTGLTLLAAAALVVVITSIAGCIDVPTGHCGGERQGRDTVAEVSEVE